MRVFCFAAGSRSLYIPLLHRHIADRYPPVIGAAADPGRALQALRAGEDVLLHIHWEEFVLGKATSAGVARARALLFTEQLRAFRRAGGRLFWTIHNLLPHRVPHVAEFLALRRFLADRAERILVHSASAIPLLQAQVDLPLDRVTVLPHPAYTDVYEPAAVTEACTGSAADRSLLLFGSVRKQKNIGGFIDLLPPEFLAARGAQIRVSGADTEAEAEQIRASQAHRQDVIWDLRYVPMEESPALIRGAACTVLPYESFLTSGVALLVLSLGGLLVAADAPQFRELLPQDNHRFLYRPGDAQDLQRVVDLVLGLSAAERAQACRANLAAAQAHAPDIIGRRLAACYDALPGRAPGSLSPACSR